MQTPNGTVRLFDRGVRLSTYTTILCSSLHAPVQDFFSAYGEDAFFVATHHYKTQSVIKYLGRATSTSKGLPYCSLSPAVAQGFLRDALTTKQLRIEIYESDGGKATYKWKLGKSASPGNLADVEELLFAHTDMLAAPVILALKVAVKDGVKTVGIAYADTSMRDMGVSEFVDNELFSNTEVRTVELGRDGAAWARG